MPDHPACPSTAPLAAERRDQEGEFHSKGRAQHLGTFPPLQQFELTVPLGLLSITKRHSSEHRDCQQTNSRETQILQLGLCLTLLSGSVFRHQLPSDTKGGLKLAGQDPVSISPPVFLPLEGYFQVYFKQTKAS